MRHRACASDLNSIEQTPRLCIGFVMTSSKCVACAQDLMSRASGFRSSLRQTPRLCSGFDPKWRKCLVCEGKSSSGGLGSMFWRTRRCLGARLDFVNEFLLTYGPPGSNFGRSGGGLGQPWGAPGPLWGDLGRSRGCPKAVL